MRFTLRGPVAAFALVAMFSLAAVTESASSSEPTAGVSGPDQTPSVVLLVLDDATMTDIDEMPLTQRLVADEGVTFTKNYSPFPACCPARATILTGQYPHNHGVLDNIAPQGGYTSFDDSRTLATYITDEYRTGLFGKYLNDNATQGSYVPPGWDTYEIPGRGDTYHGIDSSMMVDGTLTTFEDEEQTAAISQQAQAFMSSSVAGGEPFFAFISVVSPHAGLPKDDYDGGPDNTAWVSPTFRNTAARILPDDLSINEVDVRDKPIFIRKKPLMTADELLAAAERNAQRIEALQAVDAEVENIIDRLDYLGVLDETYVIVTSDNGFDLGQHRKQFGKNDAYESSAHVPLIIRGPGLEAGTTYDRVSGLQDITPTILGMTQQRGDQHTDPIDGLNLLALATGTRAPSDRVQLIEIPKTAKVSDQAIQAGYVLAPEQRRSLTTLKWVWRGYVSSVGRKYVETVPTGEVELYNLNNDPYELLSIAHDRHHKAMVARMGAKLAKLVHCSGSSCH
jgi:N-acetylglucosamine-6-sulfatase